MEFVMKKEFIGFYMPQEEELRNAWSSDKTLFIFDTNVLIKLYSYQPSTVQDFFSILEKLGNRIWLPHQVGLEFQNRRLDIKLLEKKKFKDLNNNIEDILKIEKEIEKKFLKGRFPELDTATEKLFQGIEKLLEDYKKVVNKCNKCQPSIRVHDKIRERIDKSFEGKVGKAYSPEKLEEIYVEGEDRYKNNIPPGFKDKDKDKEGNDYYYRGARYQRKFGDLIIWKQIIDKSLSDKIENIIFITDDEKEDWWFFVKENGEKAIGPLANLTHEIIDKGGASLFHMYNTTSFFEAAKSLLSSIKLQESSIEETKQVQQVYKEKDEDSFFTWFPSDREKEDYSLLLLIDQRQEKSHRYSALIFEISELANKLSKLHDDIKNLKNIGLWKEVSLKQKQIIEIRNSIIKNRSIIRLLEDELMEINTLIDRCKINTRDFRKMNGALDNINLKRYKQLLSLAPKVNEQEDGYDDDI